MTLSCSTLELQYDLLKLQVPHTPEEEIIPEDLSEPPNETPSIPVSPPQQMDNAAVSSLDKESSVSDAAVTDISMTTVCHTSLVSVLLYPFLCATDSSF